MLLCRAFYRRISIQQMWVAWLTYWQMVSFNLHLMQKKCCLLNTNQKQSRKCARQNSYLDLWSYNYYLKRSSSFKKIRLEELINKLLKWNISQEFLKALARTKKQNNYVERPPMTASSLKHDRNIILRKTAESLKLFWYEEVAGRWIEIKSC